MYELFNRALTLLGTDGEKVIGTKVVHFVTLSEEVGYRILGVQSGGRFITYMRDGAETVLISHSSDVLECIIDTYDYCNESMYPFQVMIETAEAY